jgi:hypothetical protein
LTESDTNKLDPRLVQAFLGTFAGKNREKGLWPPKSILGGDTLAINLGIGLGLSNYNKGCLQAQVGLNKELSFLDDLVDQLGKYRLKELEFLNAGSGSCLALRELEELRKSAETDLMGLESASGRAGGALTNLALRYELVSSNTANTSVAALQGHVSLIQQTISPKTSPLVGEVSGCLEDLVKSAGSEVMSHLKSRRLVVEALDKDWVPAVPTNAVLAYQARWELYTNACALGSISSNVTDNDIGDSWRNYANLSGRVEGFRNKLAAYKGPLDSATRDKCKLIAQSAVQNLEATFLKDYVDRVGLKLNELTSRTSWGIEDVTNAHAWFTKIDTDLKHRSQLGTSATKVEPLSRDLAKSRRDVLNGVGASIRGGLGFPVLLDASSTNSMKMEELGKLRALLAGLPNELNDPAWGADSQTELDLLQGDLRRYSAVVSSLVTTGRTAAKWQLFFVPPAQDKHADVDTIKYFREAHVTAGPEDSNWPKLPNAKDRMKIGEGTLDSGFRLSFRRGVVGAEPELKTPLDYKEWGIVQWLRDGNPGPSEDYRKWIFQVKLKGGRGGKERVEGNLTFEVELGGLPFPRLEDWPRSK